MRALNRVQVERLGQVVEHRRRNGDRPPLLQPGVPGGPHPSQLCQFLPPQPRRAAPSPGRQAHLEG